MTFQLDGNTHVFSYNNLAKLHQMKKDGQIERISAEQLYDFYGKPIIDINGKPIMFESYYQDYALPEVIITGKRKRKTLSGKY